MAEGEQKAVFVPGLRQTRKAVLSGAANCVLLAKNADPGLTGPLAALCRDTQVPVRWISTMRELGRTCGLTVGAAAAAVCPE